MNTDLQPTRARALPPYRRPRPPHRWPRQAPSRFTRRGRIIIGVLLLLALSSGLAARTATWITIRHHERIMPNLSVAGVALDGLTRIEAAELLAENLTDPGCSSFVLNAGGEPFLVSRDELGRRWDVDAALDAAMQYGRRSDGLPAVFESLGTLFGSSEVSVNLITHDTAAVKATAAGLAQEYYREPIESTVVVRGEFFDIEAGSDGRALNERAVIDAVSADLVQDTPRCMAAVEATPLPAVVSVAEATAAAISANSAVLSLTLTDAQESWLIESTTLREAIVFDVANGDIALSFDPAPLRAAVEALAEPVRRTATSASFTLGASGISGIVAGAEGRALNVDATTEAVSAELARRIAGEDAAPVALAAEMIAAPLPTALAQETLDQIGMLSDWTTYFVPNEGNGFSANIHIGARDLDGYVILPGSALDFWDAIGPVTEERGYTYGGVIIDGRSVAGGAIGGGICSTSTTLFNAALRAGLQIDSRAAHAYFIDRYPVGLDATVWATDSAEQSMIFSNDTAHPIIVRSITSSADSVTFQLWGVADGRTVTLSEPETWNHQTAGDAYQDTSELPPGTEKRVEFPHDGFSASVTRTVYAADGSVLHANTFDSNYKTVDGVVLRGV